MVDRSTTFAPVNCYAIPLLLSLHHAVRWRSKSPRPKNGLVAASQTGLPLMRVEQPTGNSHPNRHNARCCEEATLSYRLDRMRNAPKQERQREKETKDHVQLHEELEFRKGLDPRDQCDARSQSVALVNRPKSPNGSKGVRPEHWEQQSKCAELTRCARAMSPQSITMGKAPRRISP